MNLIDYSIGAYADAPGGTSGEFYTTCRTRIISQISDGGNDAIPVFAIDFGKLFLSGAQDVDSIIHSLHPS